MNLPNTRPPVTPEMAFRKTTTIVAIALGVLIVLLQVDIRPGFPKSLDAGWGEVLSWGIAHGAQWGKDLVFTYGPLGFVTGGLPFDPATYWPALWLQLAFGVVTALLVISVLRHLPLSAALAFAIAAIVLGYSWPTSSAMIIVYPLAAMVLARISYKESTPRLARHALVAGLAAFAALQPLIKFSTFPLWLVWIPLGAIILWRSNDRLLPATFLLASVAAPLIAWVSSGQELANLAPWLHWSWQVAAYYGTAMQAPPRLPLTDWVLFVAMVFWVVATMLFAWRTRHSLRRVSVYLMFAATLVLAYKAGATRAADGGHVMIVLSILAWCAPLLLGMHHLEAALGSGSHARGAFGVFLLGIACLSLAPLSQVYPAFTLKQLYTGRYAYSTSLHALGTLLHPRRAFDSTLAQWKQDRAALALPAIRRMVASGTVDLLFDDQSTLLANDLDYHPRPVFQSYSAYSDQLARLNAEFFLSNRAPEWVVVNWQTVGGNYPTSEDSLALIRVLQAYEPVLSEGNYLLFRRMPHFTDSLPDGNPALSLPVGFKTATPIPMPKTAAWFARLDVKLSPYAKLDAALFRAPQLKVEVALSDGSHQEFALVPNIARSGFILSPALGSNAAYLDWLRGNRSRYVTSIRLVQKESFNHHAFRNQVVLHLYPLDLPHDYPRTLALYGTFYPGFNQLPASVSGTHRLYTVDGKPVLFLPTPGSMTFKLAPGTYTVSAQFGLMPNAVANSACIAAHADGIGITIGVTGPTQAPPITAYVDPFSDPAHRYAADLSGTLTVGPDQAANVAFTIGKAATNGACDWSWIRDLKFIRLNPQP